MKKKSLLLILLLVLLLAGGAAAYRFLAPGLDAGGLGQNQQGGSGGDDQRVMAPLVSFETLDGKKLDTSDFYGKPTIINFWATWCGFCMEEMPAFQAVYETYGDRVNFLMINQTAGESSLEDVKAVLQKEGYTFPVYLDKTYSGAQAYGFTGIPMTVLVDSEGYLLGGRNAAVTDVMLIEAIEEMLQMKNAPL
ncbi:MAG: TlpA family protein disulfide reductase [Firmicutes bacterium]|nr:TlpA family protein disulfide reductase [Bacillota bacterium]